MERSELISDIQHLLKNEHKQVMLAYSEGEEELYRVKSEIIEEDL